MSKYICKANDKNFQFELIEDRTGFSIANSIFPENCKKYINKLNKGGGFDGNTPRFFCDPVLNLD